MKTATETIHLLEKRVSYSLREDETDAFIRWGSWFPRDVLADLPPDLVAGFQALVEADATGKGLLTGGNVAVMDVVKPQAGQIEYAIRSAGGALVRHGEILATDILGVLPAPLVTAFRALCVADARDKGLL